MGGVLAKGGRLSWDRAGDFLLVQLGDLGDVVLSLPAARALRERFPDSRIGMLVRDKAAGLLADRPWIDAVLEVQKGPERPPAGLRRQARFVSRLRGFGARTAVDLRTGQRGAVAVGLSGASRRLGFYAYDGGLWRNRLFTHLVYPHRPRGTPMAEQYLSLLQAHGIDTPHRAPELPVPEARRAAARRLMRREGVPLDGTSPLVALQPFSLWPYKEWPLQRQARLARWLAREAGATVLVLGAPSERDRTGVFFREATDRLINLTGRTRLDLLPAVLAQCRMFVGMDSAGLHVAAAVGTATFGIFGPTSADDWAPRGERHAVVSRPMPCVPCREKGCRGGGESRCLSRLDYETVRSALSAHMERVFDGGPALPGDPP